MLEQRLICFFTVQAGKGYNISHFCHNFNVKNDGTILEKDSKNPYPFLLMHTEYFLRKL